MVGIVRELEVALLDAELLLVAVCRRAPAHGKSGIVIREEVATSLGMLLYVFPFSRPIFIRFFSCGFRGARTQDTSIAVLRAEAAIRRGRKNRISRDK